MFQREAVEATAVIERCAEVNFVRKGGGYWYPDKIVDNNVLDLLRVKLRITKDADEVLKQLSDVAWCVFHGE